MDYTLYNSSGHWLGHASCSNANDIPTVETTQQVVSGHYDSNTMLVNGSVAPATGDALNTYSEKILDILRSSRNKVLANSDWTQAADSPLSDAKKAEWATYRQQLRDLPANTSDPANPTWPAPPS